MISLLIAQNSSNNYSTLIFFLIIFVIMYFFIIRPQFKKQRKQKEYINSLKKGDKIITIGGIHGKIVEISKKTITIDTGYESKVKLEKSAISTMF